MKNDHVSLTFDPYSRSFTYTIIFISYCLKVLSTWTLISLYEHEKNKSNRTATLGSFIIKKPKNISIASSNPNPSVEAYTETTETNLNQHALSSHINEMTTHHVLFLKITLKTIMMFE